MKPRYPLLATLLAVATCATLQASSKPTVVMAPSSKAALSMIKALRGQVNVDYDRVAKKLGFVHVHHSSGEVLLCNDLVDGGGMSDAVRFMQKVGSRKFPAIMDLGNEDPSTVEALKGLMARANFSTDSINGGDWSHCTMAASTDVQYTVKGANGTWRFKSALGDPETLFTIAKSPEASNKPAPSFKPEKVESAQDLDASPSVDQVRLFYVGCFGQRMLRSQLGKLAFADLNEKVAQQEKVIWEAITKVTANQFRDLTGRPGSWDGMSPTSFDQIDPFQQDFLAKELGSHEGMGAAKARDLLRGATLSGVPVMMLYMGYKEANGGGHLLGIDIRALYP